MFSFQEEVKQKENDNNSTLRCHLWVPMGTRCMHTLSDFIRSLSILLMYALRADSRAKMKIVSYICVMVWTVSVCVCTCGIAFFFYFRSQKTQFRYNFMIHSERQIMYVYSNWNLLGCYFCVHSKIAKNNRGNSSYGSKQNIIPVIRAEQ